MFVDRGEAPLGVVYETDALIDMKVRVVDVFPDDSHAPIVYPIALTKGAKAGAAEFVAYVRSPAAETPFKTYGFTPLALIRCGLEYTLKCFSRRKPTKVIPDATARLTARLDGAPMAASMETPERSAF
jgi:hypothetical protein